MHRQPHIKLAHWGNIEKHRETIRHSDILLVHTCMLQIVAVGRRGNKKTKTSHLITFTETPCLINLREMAAVEMYCLTIKYSVQIVN